MKYDLETTRFGLKKVTDQVLKIISPGDEEEISWCFYNQLTRVGRLAISREDAESTIEVSKNLKNFGTSTAEKGLENATVYAVWSLEKVEKAAAEKGLAGVTEQVARSLGEVGKAAAGKGRGNATQQAAGSLAELTILSEEIVKTAIHDYESKLEGKDRDSSQKFIKIYEQELEKLRA